jgi:5-methylcytosine-specific restriction endonuclease McrA
MAKRQKRDYAGFYRIGNPPRGRIGPLTEPSWQKIVGFLAAKPGGTANFDELEMVVSDHQSGTKAAPHPYQFIQYCIKNGWLERTVPSPDDSPILCESREELEREVNKIGKIQAVPKGQERPAKIQSRSSDFVRDARVVAFVFQQASDLCECCGGPSPFLRKDGQAYLEIHHVKPLTSGGRDTVDNAVAVCPNCHRELHYGREAQTLTEKLYRNVARLKPC